MRGNRSKRRALICVPFAVAVLCLLSAAYAAKSYGATVSSSTGPKVSLTPQEPNGSGYYSGDVGVAVTVDAGVQKNEGLASVEYSVRCGGTVTQQDVLYVYDGARGEGGGGRIEEAGDTGDGEKKESEATSDPEAGTESKITSGGKTDDEKENLYGDREEQKDGDVSERKAEQKGGSGEADIVGKYEGEITVDAALNNADGVVVRVVGRDRAGNENAAEVTLNILAKAPRVTVTFSDRANRIAEEDGESHGYFGKERTARVTVVDRDTVFDAEAAAAGIRIRFARGIDDAWTDVDEEARQAMISGWSADKINSDIHTASVVFPADASYEWGISYRDKAGFCVGEDGVEYTGDSPNVFTVDQTAPDGEVTVGADTWKNWLAGTLTFGLWSREGVQVRVSARDAASPLDSVQYYRSPGERALTEEELSALSAEKWMTCRDPSGILFAAGASEQFAVYVKLTDYAGNVSYCGSDGFIVDQAASFVSLTPSGAAADNKSSGAGGYYNRDSEVCVKVRVEDPAPSAGIQKIEYWITDGTESADSDIKPQLLFEYSYAREKGENKNGGTLTVTDRASGEEKITSFTGNVPEKNQLRRVWEGTVPVDKERYHTCDVVVHVRTTDNAGNQAEATQKLDIDTARPAIRLSYDNNSCSNTDADGNVYFNAPVGGSGAVRTATVSITERSSHFREDRATAGIRVTATDAGGSPVALDTSSMVSGWTTVQGAVPDRDVHTATVTFSADANYTLSVSYTDEAGNKNSEVKTGSAVAPWKFTVDATAPDGSLRAVSAEGQEAAWGDGLPQSLTFGFCSGECVTVTGTAGDATSPLASVSYYKSADTAVMSREQLNALGDGEWNALRELTVASDERFAVYEKVVDMAGNITYIGTDGMIVDRTQPGVVTLEPEVGITSPQPAHGIFNGDVTVNVRVCDPAAGGASSGLETVSYCVRNMGDVTQSGTLYASEEGVPPGEGAVRDWRGSLNVDAGLNNSNDVSVEIYAGDNASHCVREEISLKIDASMPVVYISYDNNNPDGRRFYGDVRTATIRVSERNFDPDGVNVVISNTEGDIPVLSEWTRVSEGSANGDDRTYVATVAFTADGDYTFDMDCIDLAGNPTGTAAFAEGTANEREFTIDRTPPQTEVSYDNNSARNGTYFNTARTAFVRVSERNFDAGRVQFAQTGASDGESVALPEVTWSSDGDVHTAKITYAADGDYTFDVAVTDLAGNPGGEADYGGSAAPQEFTIDTGIADPVISGVENGHAYKGVVIPDIRFSDINFEGYEISLTRTRVEEYDLDVTSRFIPAAEVSDGGGGVTCDTFKKNQNNDGIYTLSVSASDLAGNEADTSVMFSVNRFGSVYVFDPYLSSLVRDGGAYTQEVEKDLVITEYNADPLLEDSLSVDVTRDGQPLSDVKYESKSAGNERASGESGGWYQYEYKVDRANFSPDGVYKMAVSSADAAGNTPENTNYKDKDILFRVDGTPPEITGITGLEESVINAPEVDVGYTVYDAIGLASVQVYVDKKPLGDAVTDFVEDENHYRGAFRLGESKAKQSVRLVARDLAGNVTDTDDPSFTSAYPFNRLVTISTNFLVRWLANRPLFFGSIGLAAAIAGAIAVLLVSRRKGRCFAQN